MGQVNHIGDGEFAGETLGSELVSTGDFAEDANWTKQSPWTIAAGVASINGSQSASKQIYQDNLDLGVSGYFKLVYTVARTAGAVTPILDGVEGTAVEAAGTYTEYLTIPAGTANYSRLVFEADADFNGSIDDVSLKKVTVPHEWDFESPWTIAAGVASIDGSQSGAKQIKQYVPDLRGKKLVVTFTITRTAGALTLKAGTTSGTARNSADTYTEAIVMVGGDYLIFEADANFAGTIDDVSVYVDTDESVPGTSGSGLSSATSMGTSREYTLPTDSN